MKPMTVEQAVRHTVYKNLLDAVISNSKKITTTSRVGIKANRCVFVRKVKR